MESNASESLKAAAKKSWKDLVVEDSGKMKRAAGYARVYIKSFNNHRFERKTEISEPRIMLSKEIMARMTDEQKFQTVSHELAHIFDFYLRGKSNHDSVWNKIHSYMGGDGKRFHYVDVSDLRKKVLRVVLKRMSDGETFKYTKKQFEKLVTMNLIGVKYQLEDFLWVKGKTVVGPLNTKELQKTGMMVWAMKFFD